MRSTALLCLLTLAAACGGDDSPEGMPAPCSTAPAPDPLPAVPACLPCSWLMPGLNCVPSLCAKKGDQHCCAQ